MALALWVGLILCLLAPATVGLAIYGDHRWKHYIRSLLSRLDAGRVGEVFSRPMRYDARELDGLPAPVQSYFRAVLTDGQPMVAAVTIDLSGAFNISVTGDHWKPFTSRQQVISLRPGFLWDASIMMLPGVAVRVVDSLIAGKGLLRAALFGLIAMADERGEGEIARGEFMRWIAEAAWYPTALLPSQGARWEAVDERSANVTLADGKTSATLLFRFGDDGLISSFRAEARGALVGKNTVMAPWEGTWANYRKHDGMLTPLTGEVAWMRPEGRKQYFVGTVAAMNFEFAPERADFEGLSPLASTLKGH